MASSRGVTAMRCLMIAIVTVVLFCGAGTADAATANPVRAKIAERYAMYDTAIRKWASSLLYGVLAHDFIETDIDGNRQNFMDAARLWGMRTELEHFELNTTIDSISVDGTRAKVHATYGSRYNYAGAPQHSGRIVQRTFDVWEYRGSYWFLVSSLIYEQTQWLDGKIINHERATGTTEPLTLST